jgi:tRNA 2-(methylsulfanyl)-N6-isopentenyladenosine37 hydroxylase
MTAAVRRRTAAATTAAATTTGELEDILLAATPAAWLVAAAARWRELIVDHASCEKKAASTALALMFAYPEDRELALVLSRLAREELRHFEQVIALMSTLGVGYVRQQPGRYAQQLRSALHSTEPARKLDLLLMGALIEARSAERFRLLAPLLPRPLVPLYSRLADSEARHFLQYLQLARAAAPVQWRLRLATLAALEARLATGPDRCLRFHSGPPADAPAPPPG